MITRQSLSGTFDLVWDQDPALDRPVRGAFDSDAAFEAAEKVFEDKLRIAHERGDYGQVLKPGEKPTVFSFEPIRGERLHRLHGLRRASGQPATPAEVAAIAFRMALQGIRNYEGCPSLDKERADDFPDLGKMVSDSVVRQLEADGGPTLVIRLGDQVYERSFKPRPK